MTDPVPTWVGCLVLVVAPEPLTALIDDAVLRVEQMIFDDPVYVDATRVSTAHADNPLSGDLDTVAFTLFRELVCWGASPARNPAPSATFCVLVVHSDPGESARLINALANTSRLGELPILFRSAIVNATPGAEEDVERSGTLVPLIFDAINATAHEVDKIPDFSLDTEQLSRMAANTPTALDPVPAVERQPRELALEDPAVVEQVEEEANDEPGPRPPDGKAPAVHRARSSLSKLVPNSVRDRSREFLARRKLPSTGVDVIKGLSKRTDRVSLLHLVFASEPVKPPRLKRKARADFAYALTQSLLSTNYETSRGPWYVRAFSMGRRLRPGRPLPVPELLRHRDFPDQWGEHFDLFDATDDIAEAVERDRSSFRRRGVDPVRTAVVFIAGAAPQMGEDTKTRLIALCSVATVVWVSFGHSGLEDADQEMFKSAGGHVLEHHDDLVDELLQLVEPSFPVADEDELPAVSPEPVIPGNR